MKDTMKAVVVKGPDQMEILRDIPVPSIGDYEALVKIRACGYCNGTDTHIIEGTLTKEGGMSDYRESLNKKLSGEDESADGAQAEKEETKKDGEES